MIFDYYQAPPQYLFDEMKRLATEIWNTYDDTYGYRTEKLERIDIGNIRDNIRYIYGMFDLGNQHKLYQMASPELRELIFEAYKDTGIFHFRTP